MKKPIIAIIDSGLLSGLYDNDIVAQKHFFIKKETIYVDEDTNDELGHGTACTELIKKECPNALLYIIKVFNNSDKGYADLIYAALESLMHQNIDVINLSLSIDESLYNKKQLTDIITKLQKEIKIVCAVRNGSESSFPACLPDCIGVSDYRATYGSRLIINQYKEIQIQSLSVPYYLRSCDNTYKWYYGSSFSAAVVSGLIGRYLTSFKEIDFWEYLTKNTEVLDLNMCLKKRNYSSQVYNLFDECHSIFQRHVSVDCIKIDDILLGGNPTKIDDTFCLLEELGRYLGVTVNHDRFDIISISQPGAILEKIIQN